MPGKQNYIKLLDKEEKEIESNLIDDVSLQINELYTALYGIELDKEWEIRGSKPPYNIYCYKSQGGYIPYPSMLIKLLEDK